MFSGLNSFLKVILPKGLFYRSLIIVAAPIIILQLTITVVFFDSVWIKANKGMTRSLVGELKILTDVYENYPSQIEFISNSYEKNFNFTINFIKEDLPNVNYERKFSPMDRSLRRELKSVFNNNNYWFNSTKYKDLTEVRIKSKNNMTIQFLFPKEKIATSSVRLFLLWIIGPSIVLIFIAIIFLKNQTRPIIRLAKAAERFGKGDYVNEFRPSGASEIRKASYEFDRMVKRINRHLNQRSAMLSGISHDLRTPLTRLKLQLAMLSQKNISQKMSKDIDEMENMLNNYLQFAKTQIKENSTPIQVNKLLEEIVKNHNTSDIHFNSDEEIVLIARKTALKRCFNNLIQNGLCYGKNVYLSLNKTTHRIIFLVEDDGPGIPEEEYQNVFKPFYRLDKSRNLNKSGVGLGLSISEDIVNSHGGSIQLSKSKHKGLQIKVSLPF
tara:strand:+ start:69 stop:1388 length:1320 start_codon:yes stop_codon:yes gene_type:complete